MTDPVVLFRRDRGSVRATADGNEIRLQVDGADLGSFPSLREALTAHLRAVHFCARDQFETTDEDLLLELLAPELDGEFPGRCFEVFVNGEIVDVDLEDYGLDVTEIAGVDVGSVGAVLYRVGPWLQRWYPDDLERIEGERIVEPFDPRQAAIAFIEDIAGEWGGSGEEISWYSDFLPDEDSAAVDL